MGAHLHFDCFNGISGDMTLGALVDLGVDVAELESRLSKLPVGDFRLKAEKVKRAGIVATHVTVEVAEDPHGHAHLAQILEKVEAARLGECATGRATAAYRLLAEAEATVHGSTPEKIHFHEVGANDAVIDVAGAMVGVEMLGAETFSMSSVVVGSGTVKCAHGVMPVPAPATAEILKGLPTEPGEIRGEQTTPTGAAILRVLAGENGGRPTLFRAEAIGYGAGTRIVQGHPNCLRLIQGQSAETGDRLPVERERILSLETEIDDMSPEVAGYVMERLFAAGARDVQFSAVQMKKNRPGQRLHVLALPEDREKLAEIILRETSTFGVRVTEAERYCLRRRSEKVDTPLGPVEVKVGLWGETVLKASPEYEACRRIAESTGRPLREVFELARRAIDERYSSSSPPS